MIRPAPGPIMAEFARPCADRPIRLCVIADPHIAANTTGTWKMAHRSEPLFARALATATRLDPSVTLLAGDLTGDGRPDSFHVVDSLLSEFDADWVAVPGNHDVPKAFDGHDPPSPAFETRYGALPTSIEAGSVTVLAMNTASAPDHSLRTTWGGKLGEQGRRWLRDRLTTVETPVIVFHHNVGALPDAPGDKYQHFQLEDAEEVTEILSAHDVPLVINGHHHVPAINAHGATMEVIAPAVCSYPQAMLSVDIDQDGTIIRLIPLATQDEVAAARRAAVTGKPLATGVAQLVDRRIDTLPLWQRSATDRQD
jgi:Icc protein